MASPLGSSKSGWPSSAARLQELSAKVDQPMAKKRPGLELASEFIYPDERRMLCWQLGWADLFASFGLHSRAAIFAEIMGATKCGRFFPRFLVLERNRSLSS